MNCKNCVKRPTDENPVAADDLDKARLTRTIKHLIIAYAATVIAFVVAFAVTVIAINGKWAGYLSEFDTISYDYEQDGNGVNIIGDENGVKFNVTEAASESAG